MFEELPKLYNQSHIFRSYSFRDILVDPYREPSILTLNLTSCKFHARGPVTGAYVDISCNFTIAPLLGGP